MHDPFVLFSRLESTNWIYSIASSTIDSPFVIVLDRTHLLDDLLGQAVHHHCLLVVFLNPKTVGCLQSTIDPRDLDSQGIVDDWAFAAFLAMFGFRKMGVKAVLYLTIGRMT